MQQSCTSTPPLGPKAEAVYQNLRARIVRGEWRPGDRLPTQQALSAGLGLSNVTVHRAMARLIADGLVVARQGAGVFVARPGPATRARIISYMYSQPNEQLVRAQSLALSRGYTLSVFCETQNRWHPRAERTFLEQVRDQRHHALLAFCSPTQPRNDALLAELERSGVRVLHTEHYRPELPDEPYLLPDFDRAGHMAVMTLLLAGYSSIHLLSVVDPASPEAPPFARLACQGFRRAMQDHAPGQPESQWYRRFPSRDEWATELPRLCRELPDNAGLVCLMGENAPVLREALERHGRDVPGQLGMVTLDVAGHAGQRTVDTLTFRRPRLLERAMAAVTAPDWDKPPRELAAPVHERHGSLRSRCP